jgi:hypothetical protein
MWPWGEWFVIAITEVETRSDPREGGQRAPQAFVPRGFRFETDNFSGSHLFEVDDVGAYCEEICSMRERSSRTHSCAAANSILR